MEQGNKMKRTLSLASLLFLLCAASAHAQLYKWVGPDGKVTYSDTPPPKSAARVETKSSIAGGTNSADFPYELSEAVKNHPVTLYATSNCIPCDEGRKLLSERGIPFTEKTVSSNDDIVALKKINSDAQLPLLIVGRSKERGFETSMWNTALTAAGYPETSKLPKSYRNPPVEAAAPAPKSVASNAGRQAGNETAAPAPNASELPPAVGNAPPGFRF
jgi:glutaredoxin